MKKIVLILLSLTLLLSAKDEYILVDDYLKNNQNQKITYDNFSKLVKMDSEKISIKQIKPVKIYMVYPGKQASDYWRRSKSSFEMRLKELEVVYELHDYFTQPGIDISSQTAAISKALSDDTDYLIFTLDAKVHYKFITTLLNREKPKLILQNITTPLRAFKDKQPFLYDGFDHEKGAKILADEYLKEVGKDGEYAILYGTQGYVSYMRGDRFINYISKKSNLKMVESYYTDFNKEKAKLATLDLIKNHKDLKFIYACSTDIALGIIEALKEHSLLGKIKVNGWGGGSAELEAIQKQEMDFTVMRMNDDNGVAMAEAIKLDLENKKDEVPLIYSGDFKLVKKYIATDELDKLKERAFRYSGK